MGRPKIEYMNTVIKNLKARALEIGADITPLEGLADKIKIASELRKILNKARPYPKLGDLVTILDGRDKVGGKITSILDKRKVEITVDENGSKRIAIRNSRGTYFVENEYDSSPVELGIAETEKNWLPYHKI